MRLVLDTNIFISAFYWGGNSQKIIDRIIEDIDQLFITSEILDELASVMRRPKFKSTLETIEKYIMAIEKISKKIIIPGNIKGICRDEDDDNRIECGVLSNADYIVTGDEDLLVLEKYNDIKIVSPNKYLESVTMQSSVTAVVYLLVHSLEWGFGSGGIKQKELIKQKK